MELRKKVADEIPDVRWEDLILACKKDYDCRYNSKKLSEIDTGDIYDQCCLFSVIFINGGSDSNSLKYKK